MVVDSLAAPFFLLPPGKKKKHGWRNLTGKGKQKKRRRQEWWLVNVDRETRNVRDQQVEGRDILSLLVLLQIISTEFGFTLTKQDLAPVALCSKVRRTFKDDKDNTKNFPSFCMSSGCQGTGPSFWLLLVFAVFPDPYQEHTLTVVGRIAFYSTLPLFASLWKILWGKNNFFFFQCCYSHNAHELFDPPPLYHVSFSISVSS